MASGLGSERENDSPVAIRLVLAPTLASVPFARVLVEDKYVVLGRQVPAIPLALFLGQAALAMRLGIHEPVLHLGPSAGLGRRLYKAFSNGMWPRWAAPLEILRDLGVWPLWRQRADVLVRTGRGRWTVSGVCRAETSLLSWDDTQVLDEGALWLALTELLQRVSPQAALSDLDERVVAHFQSLDRPLQRLQPVHRQGAPSASVLSITEVDDRPACDKDHDMRRREFIGMAGTMLATAAGSTAQALGADTRRLLSQCAQLAMGVGEFDVSRWLDTIGSSAMAAASQIGIADVRRIEAVTRSLRGVDYRYGGGACQSAVVAHLNDAQTYLLSHQDDATRRALLYALADLNNLAGWVSFDAGDPVVARRYFERALEQATFVDDRALVADVLCRTGRSYLYQGSGEAALRFLQLGQVAAQDSGCHRTVAALCANEAWAYALLGDAQRMEQSMRRAEDEFVKAEVQDGPPALLFLGSADLVSYAGIAAACLPSGGDSIYEKAVSNLQRATDNLDQSRGRSRAFNRALLARVHLANHITDAFIATAEAMRPDLEGLNSASVQNLVTHLGELPAAGSIAAEVAADLKSRPRGMVYPPMD